MKNLLNLKGAQKLSKNEQQSINGGDLQPRFCDYLNPCYGRACCIDFVCSYTGCK